MRRRASSLSVAACGVVLSFVVMKAQEQVPAAQDEQVFKAGA